jgi:hypothetical protein
VRGVKVLRVNCWVLRMGWGEYWCNERDEEKMEEGD